MKLSHKVLAALFTTALTACGGGGGDESTGPAMPPGGTSVAEFEGTWHDRPGRECLPDFAYNTAYYHRLREATVTAVDGQLRMASATLVFSDAACTLKQGLVTETLLLTLTPTTITGRDRVYRSVPSLVSASASADGGAGLTLTQMPDGELTGLTNRKVLIDVDGTRLYATSSDDAAALDAQGYPAAFHADRYLVR